ncbi:MAG: PmoA family protein [Verrucomicrobiales bacterium]
MKPLLLAIAFGAVLSSLAGEATITVHNGEMARTDVILTVPFPPGLRGKDLLIDPNGSSIPLQVVRTNTISFVVPTMQPNEKLSYTFRASNEGRKIVEHLKAVDRNGKVTLSAGEASLLVYQANDSDLPRPEIKPIYKRGGYLHPVFSPSGRIVTDDYPPNHVHHHGIWMPWTKTEFEGRAPDFWNMGDGKGKVEFSHLLEHWSGPVQSGFRAEHRFIDLTSGKPKTALNETWAVASYGIIDGPIEANVFDLESIQTTATDSPLKLPKYFYGGLGFRGNWTWNGPNNTFFLSSEGITNRLAGNESRAKWCYIGGEIDGQQTGLAILCHPQNFRFPQPMRWHPTEPFFCYAPSQLGDWEIKPGEAYVSRYRFVVFDGKPNREWIEGFWQNYANPPEVTISSN